MGTAVKERSASQRAAEARYDAGHREKRRAAAVRWREQNPEKVRADNARWRTEHPEYDANWRARNPERARAIRIRSEEKHREERVARRKATYTAWMEDARASQGGACRECGSTEKLHFHHSDPADKKAAVSQLVGKTRSAFDAEAAKTLLLCRQCHMRAHYAREK